HTLTPTEPLCQSDMELKPQYRSFGVPRLIRTVLHLGLQGRVVARASNGVFKTVPTLADYQYYSRRRKGVYCLSLSKKPGGDALPLSGTVSEDAIRQGSERNRLTCSVRGPGLSAPNYYDKCQSVAPTLRTTEYSHPSHLYLDGVKPGLELRTICRRYEWLCSLFMTLKRKHNFCTSYSLHVPVWPPDVWRHMKRWMQLQAGWLAERTWHEGRNTDSVIICQRSDLQRRGLAHVLSSPEKTESFEQLTLLRGCFSVRRFAQISVPTD
ncbi:hypothetical protein BaRGS_00003073, partial [Batillaria attramentaria]